MVAMRSLSKDGQLNKTLWGDNQVEQDNRSSIYEAGSHPFPLQKLNQIATSEQWVNLQAYRLRHLHRGISPKHARDLGSLLYCLVLQANR